MKKNTINVLTILFDNLKNTQPQLVPSATIADQMNLNLKELQQLLKSMKGLGIIETDPDMQLSLITPRGLLWLDRQRPHISARQTRKYLGAFVESH